jgi:hypothetical protein
MEIARFRVIHITIYFSVYKICLGSLYKLKHTVFRADVDRTEVSLSSNKSHEEVDF